MPTGLFRSMRVRVRNGTDHKIRVHITICVVALIVASLLYREARQQGFDHGFDAWMETVSSIRGVMDLPLRDSRERPPYPSDETHSRRGGSSSLP